MPCIIRLARDGDLMSINDIYNYFVRHSTCTYQETPEPLAARQAWFDRAASTTLRQPGSAFSEAPPRC
jgi:L-amino acid N-acyltransferase YncA